MSLVQGGEAPSCFSKAVADYFVYGDIRSPVDISDIPDQSIQKSLTDVSNCTTENRSQFSFNLKLHPLYNYRVAH